MKLLRCHVENFGILSDFDLTFTEGLNVLCRENGFGKSTLAAFLKAMFYGLPKTRAKASERKRYDPWQGGKYGGFLEFEYRGNQYRVTRYFGKKEDSFSLTDLTNRAESTAFSEKLGEELFQLDGDSFARSTFVPQLSDREITATTSIRAKLTNLVEDTNDLNNYDTAMKQLQEYRKSLKLFKGEGGQTAQLRRECRELEASIHTTAEKKEPLEAVCQQIDALNREKNEKTAQQAFLREQIRQADAQKALRLQQENLERLRGQVRGREKELSDLDGRYPKGYPALEALRAQQENLTRAAHARQRIERRANADASGLSEEEKTRLEALNRQFSQGIPGEEDLFFFNIVTAGTDGVSRCFKYFPYKSGDGKLVTLLHGDIRCDRIRLSEIACHETLLAIRQDIDLLFACVDRYIPGFLQFLCRHDMVEVTVGQKDRFRL